jgi:hypothetical protein
MVNDGSGNLSWANFNFDQMSDTIVTDVSDFQVLRFDGTNFVNVNTVLSGGASQILRTDASGHLASEALQYPLTLVGNTLTGVGMAVGSSDMVSRAYADANAIDTGINTINLNSAYHYGPVLTTNSTDGFLEITGSESLESVCELLPLADSSDDTKFSKVFYKHGITPLGQYDLGYSERPDVLKRPLSGPCHRVSHEGQFSGRLSCGNLDAFYRWYKHLDF